MPRPGDQLADSSGEDTPGEARRSGSSTKPTVLDSGPTGSHRRRGASGPAAPDELEPVGLAGDALPAAALAVMRWSSHGGFSRGARPPRAEDGLRIRGEFGLHEQVAEGRMRRVGGGGASTTSA
jgi:hypothetical protein